MSGLVRTSFAVAALATCVVSMGCDRSGSTPGGAAQGGGAGQPSSAQPVYDAATVKVLNEAAALMGRFEFEAAFAKYGEALALPSKPPEAALGRAIATLNQSREGTQDEALAMLADFLATNPSAELALRARYCQGLCFLYLGRAGEAAAAFMPVAEARSTDAYALYFAAQSLEQIGETAKALAWYQKSAERDPYLKSAELGVQRCARKLGDDKRAEAALKAFERLAVNPRARNAEFKYTRMGPLGLAVVADSPARREFQPPQGNIFDEPMELPIRWPEGFTPKWSNDADQHVVTVDIDMDGRLDAIIARAVRLPSAAGSDEVRSLVLMATEDGAYRAEPDHPLVGLLGGGVQSILAGDIDADGRTDLYACRTGGNALLLADENGAFRDATVEARVGGRGRACVDGALADLDHDGDLDLFLCYRDAPNQLYVNKLDGTFREIGEQAGVASEELNPVGVIVGDFDFDRDCDIFVLNENSPNECFLNDRLLKWVPGRPPGLSEQQLGESAASAAVVELTDIPLRRFVLATSGYLQFPTRNEMYARNASPRLAVGDVTGDGHQDLVVFGVDRTEVRDQSGRLLVDVPVPPGRLRSALVTLDPLRGPEIITIRVDGAPLVHRAGPARGPYAAIRFSGRTDPSQSMRSNTSGIGTSYAARIGNEWFGGEAFRASTGRGQSLTPVSIGTGPFDRIDYVEIEWSDGVFQSEPALETGRLHVITETQRQISSCPVVFAWNGSELAFVTDVLGVGGIGYLLEPGVYSEPRPRETIVLPAQALVPKPDGTLSLSLAEPMEESCMLDSVRLLAVDLPEGWDVAPDERMGMGGAMPTGEPIAWRSEWLPTNDDALVQADLTARDVGPVDARFIGRLASEQIVDVEFDVAIDSIPEPWLVIDGWIEYAYGQTMFAASQAGATYAAPSLEARGADGSWHELVATWGFPAGMPRRMALPIPKDELPKGATALRMRTNMEIYFDSIRLVAREPLPAQPVELELVRATLASVGFAYRTTGPQKQPFYDRGRLLPLWDCRFQRGLYTEFGDVRELLAREDGALVVFGPGEEVAFDFASPAAAPAPGSRRRYLLDSRGWCKDMDVFTRDGETIEPLPVQPIDDRARDLMKSTRTRPAGGRS
jgi:tetratricopeptide (TPR) repeat protein